MSGFRKMNRVPGENQLGKTDRQPGKQPDQQPGKSGNPGNPGKIVKSGHSSRRWTAARIARLGMWTAIALVLAYVESLLPPLNAALQGVKLGLPNIAVLFVLYREGVGSAAAVSMIRLAAASLLFGNPVTFVYGFAGAVLSLAMMVLLRRGGWFSPVGVSVAGGVSHNVGQVLVAMWLLDTGELGYYLILLAVSGTAAGVFIGLAGAAALRYLPKGPKRNG